MSLRTKHAPTIGILALQGDFAAHREVVERLGAAVVSVRRPAELETVDSLILPGGESTTIGMLIDRIGLVEPIKSRVRAGMPIYGTCAGMILLANEIEERPDQPTLGLMDITVARNAFGRQVDSFEADITVTAHVTETIRGVFIRAPYVTRTGPDVAILARYQDRIVGVRQGNRLATAFHPELANTDDIHALFVEMTAASQEIR